MQKLIKLNPEHYIIVDDSKINNGDVHFDFDKNEIDIWEGNLHSNRFKCKKITHSTQPLESMNHGNYSSNVYLDIEKLSLQEVKELIGEVDVEKNMWYERNVKSFISNNTITNIIIKAVYCYFITKMLLVCLFVD